MVDAWSCGIILFALCTGYLPFFDENTKNLFKMILRTEVKYPKEFPPGARNICERLLMKDPNERATLAEIKKHPWFVIDFVDDSEPTTAKEVTKREQTKTHRLPKKKRDNVMLFFLVLLCFPPSSRTQPPRSCIFTAFFWRVVGGGDWVIFGGAGFCQLL